MAKNGLQRLCSRNLLELAAEQCALGGDELHAAEALAEAPNASGGS